MTREQLPPDSSDLDLFQLLKLLSRVKELRNRTQSSHEPVISFENQSDLEVLMNEYHQFSLLLTGRNFAIKIILRITMTFSNIVK